MYGNNIPSESNGHTTQLCDMALNTRYTKELSGMTIALGWFILDGNKNLSFLLSPERKRKTFAILTLSCKAALRSSTVSLALLRIRAQFLANCLAPAVS